MASRKRREVEPAAVEGPPVKRRSARHAAQKDAVPGGRVSDASAKSTSLDKNVKLTLKSKNMKKVTSKAKPKEQRAQVDSIASVSARAVSEEVDVDSIPDRNPDIEIHDGDWYWLMKAEPETRLENGVDVKFSIDDLRQRTKPEPWDGIRAYPARNNLRAMNVGDKAFFYHSNCKEPAIVGIMEIVKEFSEDKSARRPGAPYYDASSTKEKPKWGLVHVEFRKKFAVPIKLKELREMGQTGKPLQQMQMLKQSRLSVSRVSKDEWLFLCTAADEKAKAAGLDHETG